MTAILDQLQLPSLKDRRTQNRLILFCKNIHGQANLPSDQLKKPSRTTKNMHSQHFLRLQTKTDTLKYSFIPNTIKDWNLLPPDIFTKIQTAEEPAKTFSEIVRGVQLK